MATKYVSALGNNGNNGDTSGTAYKTGQFAATQTGSGDTIVLLDEGDIVETGTIALPEGVSIIGQGVNAPVMRINHSGTGITMFSGSVTAGNQTLSDFTMDGNNRNSAAGIECRNRTTVVFEDLLIRNFDQFGLTIRALGSTSTTPPAEYLTGVEVTNVELLNCSKDFSEFSNGSLMLNALDGAEISYVTINENRGYGIKFIGGGWFKHLNLHHCNITVPTSDPLWTQDISIELWNLSDDCEIHDNIVNTWLSMVRGSKGGGTWALKLYNNQVLASPTASPKEGVELLLSDVQCYDNVFENFGNLGAFAIWSGTNTVGDIGNIQFFRNKCKSVYGSSVAGVLWNVGLTGAVTISDVKIYNNVFECHSWGVQMRSFAGKPLIIDDFELRNNIFMGTPDAMVRYVGASSGALTVNNPVYTHNTFFQGGSIISSNNTNVTVNSATQNNILTSDPKINSFPDYSLQDTSPCIDAGVDVGLPFNGGAPDIGVVEFGEGGGVQSVTSFTLINSDTDTPISSHDPITNGIQINRNAVPFSTLNIRANVNPSPVGSVEFDLVSNDGSDDLNVIRNTAPYALFDQTGGDYDDWEPGANSYSLTATPYTEADGGGSAGTPLTINFGISGEPTPPWRQLSFPRRLGVESSTPVLSVPPNFRNVINSDTEALLMWTDVPDADTFELQRADNSVFTIGVTQLKDDPTLGYVDTTRTAETTAYYRVRSKKTTGETSAWSAVAVSTTGSSHLDVTVDTLSWVDADNDTLHHLVHSIDILDTDVFGTANLNMAAVPSTTHPIRFHYDSFDNYRHEGGAPYAAFGDVAGNYSPFVFTPGKHVISCHAYNTSTQLSGKIEVYTFIVGTGIAWQPDDAGISLLFTTDYGDEGTITRHGSSQIATITGSFGTGSVEFDGIDTESATTEAIEGRQFGVFAGNTDSILSKDPANAFGKTGNPTLTFFAIAIPTETDNGAIFDMGDADGSVTRGNIRLCISYSGGIGFRHVGDTRLWTTSDDLDTINMYVWVRKGNVNDQELYYNGITLGTPSAAGTANPLVLTNEIANFGTNAPTPTAQPANKQNILGCYDGELTAPDIVKLHGYLAHRFPSLLTKLRTNDNDHAHYWSPPTI